MQDSIPSENVPLKRCPGDDQWHPATSEFFYRNKNTSDGFNTPCKRCQKEYQKHPRPVLPPVPEGYKRCSTCKEVKLLEDFSDWDRYTSERLPVKSKQMGKRPSCKKCRNGQERIRLKSHPRRHRMPRPYNPHSSRKTSIKKNYGITIEEYQHLFDQQNGLCAICKNAEIVIVKRTGKLKQLAVDHCHKTGKVRALLCGACNRAFGLMGEDPDRIRGLLAYAERWQAQK